jgi:hypothetical protein
MHGAECNAGSAGLAGDAHDTHKVMHLCLATLNEQQLM